MTKHLNWFLFLCLLAVFLYNNTAQKISTAMHTVLPQSQEKKLLEQFLRFDSTKKLFIVSQGLTETSLARIQEVEKELQDFSLLKKESLVSSKSLQDFKKQYYFHLHSLKKNPADINVKDELKALYERIINSFITPFIKEQDPFNLIEIQAKSLPLKNGRLIIPDYGYLSVYSLNNASTLEQYEVVYDTLRQLEKNHSSLQTFSPLYYFVENSRNIKNDATTIVMLATLLLLIMYGLILRNIKLLAHTLITLASSALFALICLTLWYEEISLFVMVFGLCISTIAIDYMFHHYFHEAYFKKSPFNKEVFLGFFTTFGVFFILSFTPFLLIQQIAQFAMISLLYSYVIFAFLYTRLIFSFTDFNFKIPQVSFLKTVVLIVFAFICILFSSFYFRFDFNIKSLITQNSLLTQQERFFKEKLNQENFSPLIIKAQNIEELLVHNETIHTIDPHSKSPLNQLLSQKAFKQNNAKLNKKDFDALNQKIKKAVVPLGFAPDAYKEAYVLTLDAPTYTQEQLHAFNVPILEYQGELLSVVQVSNTHLAQVLKMDFVYSVSLRTLFEKNLKQSAQSLIYLGALALMFIFTVILLTAKKQAFKSMVFLLFPTALIALYFIWTPINILHLFMVFIVIAISIDYAIYISKDTTIATKKAIVFSALSSFAGFGVLIFSSVPALFSIGSVATLGIIGILILIFFQGNTHGTSRS